MSFFTVPRLAFSGTYQADVSTVNNDVRHFDNDTFQPNFQEFGQGTTNGWYNPEGTGDFRLIGVRVHQAVPDASADPKADPATKLFVNAQKMRSACKIVDLDPQMQIVSTLFGLRLVLTDGTDDWLAGIYKPSPFRDMSNGRQSPGSAVFISILTDLEWGEKAATSPTLVKLRNAAEANAGKLAVNLTPTTMGTVVGSIGVWNSGDPETFVAGRRLVNDTGPNAPVVVGDMMADVLHDTLSFDFSNSINLGQNGQPAGIGEIYGAILRTPDTGPAADQQRNLVNGGDPIVVGTENGDTVAVGDIKLLSRIDYSAAGFMTEAAGIADCPLDTEASELILDHPVALVRKIDAQSYRVVIRETNGGFYTRADNFVHRIDPPLVGAVGETVRFKVTQYGRPVNGVSIATNRLGTGETNRYWGPGGTGPGSPTAPYPDINEPADALTVASGFASADEGWADCPVSVSNPKNPRGYVDGQIYTTSYSLALGNASAQAPFDLIVIHAREAKEYPDKPAWKDIEKFMQQYDNLYPIMSKHLFSLADPEVLKNHATLLTLAFTRDMDDPNHMPATRDLSSYKRQAVLSWLAEFTGESAPKVAAARMAAAPPYIRRIEPEDMPRAHPGSAKVLKAMLEGLGDDDRGKTPVMRAFLTAEIKRLEGEG